MKCPKCGYLGFEPSDRCRNCGYEFSLASTAPVPELPLRAPAPTPAALEDFPIEREGTRSSPPPSGELPLFSRSVPDDDRPLITKVSPPRPPLAVRRTTLDVSRVRPDTRPPQTLDLALDADPPARLPTPLTPGARAAHDEPKLESGRYHHYDAGVMSRIAAVGIDLVLLAVVDVLVVYLTMQICGVSLDDLWMLPRGPLLAFLLLQNGGYLVAFTAGGQTLGKMAAGIRVISSDRDRPLDVGRALVRTAIWIVLAIPAGLGFLTALFSRDHRGLHDRFAGTRVVR